MVFAVRVDVIRVVRVRLQAGHRAQEMLAGVKDEKLVILESTPQMDAYMRAHASRPGDPGVYDVAAMFPEAVIPAE